MVFEPDAVPLFKNVPSPAGGAGLARLSKRR